ncbi:MAG: NAD(P)/FAD-dependent oxidoreductase, partial [Candidatus Omnitrophota bacterium]
MSKHIDLAIIGAGIGGVSSAVYAKRAGISCLLFESNAIGGQLLFMENIDNYVGIEAGTKGSKLAETLAKTVADLKIDIVEENIVKIEDNKDHLHLYAQDCRYVAKGIVAATGA